MNVQTVSIVKFMFYLFVIITHYIQETRELRHVVSEC